jgi:hypothetical protein
MTNQEAKTAIIDRAVECLRLAERAELASFVANAQQRAVD